MGAPLRDYETQQELNLLSELIYQAQAAPNGNIETSEYRRQFCGHYKDQASKNNIYNPALFLNPTELEDIEDYFYYDAEKGKISNHPEKSTTSRESADYMISILNLDNEGLQKMRAIEYSNWLRDYITYGEEWIIEQLDENLDELPPFYSMLKSKFL